MKILKPFLGKLKNISTGIEANLSKKSLEKMTSAKSDVLITVKESLANGHRIYSIELDEINKASERFEGLSDAAVKTANRATKTPHIDNLNLTHKSFDVNEEGKQDEEL